jgi:tetratricopeptide (TPR) repeat protein
MSVLYKFFVVILAFLCHTIANGQLAYLETARYQLSQGLYLEAINTLTYQIEKEPDKSEPYIKRAHIYGILGMNRERDADFKIAHMLHPLSNLYLNPVPRTANQATKKYSYNWLKDQETELKSAFDKSPMQPQVYMNMVRAFEKNHKQDSIISAALMAIHNQDYKLAEEIMERADTYLSNTGIIYDIKGVIALKMGHLEEALDLFTLSIIHLPQFASAYHHRSICHKLLNNYAAAEQDVKKAIELNSQISIFYFTKALLQEQTNNNKQAKRDYEKALDLDSEYTEAQTNYGQLLKSLGQYDHSIEELNKAIRLAPDQYHYYFLRGGIHLTVGDYQRAIDDFDTYLIEYPDDGGAYYNKGLAQLLNNDTFNGCQNLKRGHELGYDNIDDLSMYICNN